MRALISNTIGAGLFTAAPEPQAVLTLSRTFAPELPLSGRGRTRDQARQAVGSGGAGSLCSHSPSRVGSELSKCVPR